MNLPSLTVSEVDKAVREIRIAKVLTIMPRSGLTLPFANLSAMVTVNLNCVRWKEG